MRAARLEAAIEARMMGVLGHEVTPYASTIDPPEWYGSGGKRAVCR